MNIYRLKVVLLFTIIIVASAATMSTAPMLQYLVAIERLLLSVTVFVGVNLLIVALPFYVIYLAVRASKRGY